MIKIDVHEFEAHLCRYLKALEKGETILLCKGDDPVAEIRPLTPRKTRPRPIGLCKGQFELPRSFFEPLPEDLVKGFEGRPG